MKGFRKKTSNTLSKSDIWVAKGTQGGTQGDPRGTQKKSEETKEDTRRPERNPGSQMYQKCDTVSKNKGDPRETQGHPRQTPRGVNRAWRPDETAFREKVFFCKSQIGPGVSRKPTTTKGTACEVLLTLQRNGRKSGKHHFYEVKVRGSWLGGPTIIYIKKQ